MPTAARLFALVGFAVMAFFASEIYKPLLPEGTQVGLLTPINVAIGALVGWLVMGRLAGKGYYAAAGSGVRTTAVALFYVLVAWSLWEMLQRSMKLRYDGPMEAIQAMMGLIADYAMLMKGDPQMYVILLGGGILAAFLSEWAARRWA